MAGNRAALVKRLRECAWVVGLRGMPNNPERVRTITEAVTRYLSLLVDGSVEGLVDMYADDATVEDPVGGGEVHIGRYAIHRFYSDSSWLEADLKRECELMSLRVAGREAAFQFRLTVTSGDEKLRLEPIDTMAFDDRGKVTMMKAYWSAADIIQL